MDIIQATTPEDTLEDITPDSMDLLDRPGLIQDALSATLRSTVTARISKLMTRVAAVADVSISYS